MAEPDARSAAPPGTEPALSLTAPEAPPLGLSGQAAAAAAPIVSTSTAATPTKGAAGLGPLTAYFLKLGTLGFGGPAALVGYMHRDLVVDRGWIDEGEYKLALGLAQIMPGPLAAQLAIALGYFQHGILGATTVGVAFILPSFLMVIAISMAYVALGGLWWMQALFYAIGATVIALIALSAYKLTRSVNKRDPLLWSVFAVLMAVTVLTQAEPAEFFIAAGLLVLLVHAWPGPRRAVVVTLAGVLVGIGIWLIDKWFGGLGAGDDNVLAQILFFFTKAGAFVFGSGLAIVPFLQQGVVQQFGWLTENQFLDAVAVAMITPGPVVITVAFVGYLVAGLTGATLAAIGIFLPVYVFTIVPAPWFKRHRENPQLKGFVDGATAAATGAIAGAVIVLGTRAIFDVPTALIALVSFGVLWRFKLPEPVVVLASGALGLVLWPLVRAAG
jgi:chromate transporter